MQGRPPPVACGLGGWWGGACHLSAQRGRQRGALTELRGVRREHWGHLCCWCPAGFPEDLRVTPCSGGRGLRPSEQRPVTASGGAESRRMGRGRAWQRVQGGGFRAEGQLGPRAGAQPSGQRMAQAPGPRKQLRPWAALTPHAPRLTHSPADCLHPASQALGLPDAQASGLIRPGCVAWRPACASSPPAPVTAALFSTLPLSVFPSWKWSHPHHSLPCPLIFQIQSSRRQSPHLHGPSQPHPHPVGGTQGHLHGAPTSSLGTGPRWH